jgi:hypothetical protein
MSSRILSPPAGALAGFGATSSSERTGLPAAAWVLYASRGNEAPGGVPAAYAEDLERIPLRDSAIDRIAEHMLTSLRGSYGDAVLTPGGISWLEVHHVRVRRLLRQLARKLLALAEWPPFAQAPYVGTDVTGSAFASERETSAREYRYMTVTWPGVAYLLGAPASPPAGSDVAQSAPEVFEPVEDVGSAGFMAVSWTSRHVQTLGPVLAELGRRGNECLVVDLSTDPAQAFPEMDHVVVQRPTRLLEVAGGVGRPRLLAHRPGRTVDAGSCVILLDRLAEIVASLLERPAGSTQPSWAATVQVEALFSRLLNASGWRALMCCNDASPLGYLAVRTADAAGVDTVYLQHGAWVTADDTGLPLHSRRILVMGERDAALAGGRTRHSEPEIHVVGQVRFDALRTFDRDHHRAILRDLLRDQGERIPDRIALFTLQPAGVDDTGRQLDAVVWAVRLAGPQWGLVVAPHPAQPHEAVERLIHRHLADHSDYGAGRTALGLTGPGVGGAGCLGGADAVLSVSSTCGIEALLLDIPVLELALGTGRTLRLAELGAAQLCMSVPEIADALNRALTLPTPTTEVKNAVCRWDGHTAARVADLLEGGRVPSAVATLQRSQHGGTS